MEGGNTNEYANLVRLTDEHGNPLQTTLAGTNDDGRQGLSTNVGYATGGAGCHYDFGDTTGHVGFGAAGSYLNQHGAAGMGGGETRAGDGYRQWSSDGHEERMKNKELPEKMRQ